MPTFSPKSHNDISYISTTTFFSLKNTGYEQFADLYLSDYIRYYNFITKESAPAGHKRVFMRVCSGFNRQNDMHCQWRLCLALKVI